MSHKVAPSDFLSRLTRLTRFFPDVNNNYAVFLDLSLIQTKFLYDATVHLRFLPAFLKRSTKSVQPGSPSACQHAHNT